MRTWMGSLGLHTFLVPLTCGYLEYSQCAAITPPGQTPLTVWRRTVSYNHVVWC